MNLNNEQQQAIELASDFIEKGNPNEWFIISGKAGTGKTFLANTLAFKFKRKRIAVACLAHAAVKVIKDKFDENLADFYTIAALLGFEFNDTTGSFAPNPYKECPIQDYDLLIIDEASMINEEMLELILSMKRKSCKLIFLGDIGQLPPIRTLDNPYYKNKQLFEKDSPVFNTRNIFYLTERIRQGEDNKILVHADYYYNNELVPEKISNENLQFTTWEESFDEIIEKFQTDDIKLICYKNETRQLFNSKIRNGLGISDVEFAKDELLIFNDSFGQDWQNGQIIKITSISEIKTDDIGCKYFTIKCEEGTLKLLSSQSKVLFQNHVKGLFDKAKSLKGTKQYTAAIKNAWKVAKNTYPNIDYAYAITSHKAQGSTYNYAVVMESEINNVKSISNTTKNKSIYVALTRARFKNYII